MNPQSKLNFSQKTSTLTNRSQIPELLHYLSGYAVASMNLDVGNRGTFDLFEQINGMADLIQDKIISMRNCIEIVCEAITKTTAIKLQDGGIARRAQETMQFIVGEMVSNQSYLRDKWKRQSKEDEDNKKSVEMAMKLIREQEREQRRERDERQKCDIECQICLVDIDLHDVGTIQCGHLFHRGCLSGHISSSIQSNRLEIKGPMEGCGHDLNVLDIKEYIDAPLIQKFEQHWFNRYVEINAKDTSWCPTPGCSSVFTFDDKLTDYRCLGCKNHYCLKCKCPYHNGMTCAEYRVNNHYGEEDRKFEAFVKGARYKQCPKCNFWVERTEGCSTMTCRCRHVFCYDCGRSGSSHGGSCMN